MQLDQTHITIRERTFVEILDLALQVLRVHWWPLVIALVAGTLPFALLNYYLIGDQVQSNVLWDESENYFFVCLWLTVWEVPVATAPITLYLGQVTFNNRLDVNRLVRDYFSSLVQMFLLQGVLRGILTIFIITLLLPYASWPYLNEIILLERNPLFGGKKSLTTRRRSRNLHNHSSGNLLTKWFTSMATAAVLCAALTIALAMLVGILQGKAVSQSIVMLVLFPLAVWIVAGYFAVVRFLSYLDMRIRREGWEVELSLRAEAQRLAGGITI